MNYRQFSTSTTHLDSRIAECERMIKDAQDRITWYQMLQALTERLHDGWQRTAPPTKNDRLSFFVTGLQFDKRTPATTDVPRIIGAKAVWLNEHLDDPSAANAQGVPTGCFADVSRHTCSTCKRDAPVIGQCFFEDVPKDKWVLHAYTVCFGCPELTLVGTYSGPSLIPHAAPSPKMSVAT